MDEDQILGYNLIMEGHNVCITGQAGTGKSYLIKKAVHDLRKRGAHVALTSSTGIGTSVFENERAYTLHKWAGIEDGRHDNFELAHLIVNDERYVKVNKEIKNTEYLFIDEISMISSKIFNQVEFVCRKVRNSSQYFGGLVVVISGDFWQLPPVKNEIYGDFGHHCFTVDWFNNVFPHRINLNIIHRQTDVMLINAVNDLERGKLSAVTTAFITSLSRPLSPDMENKSVYLFSRNIDVDLFNYEKVQSLPGELHVFKSEDEGDSHYINQFLAPKNLGLKVGCPVMLLINLTDDLVNGKIGKVVKIESEQIYVEFLIGEQRKTVKVSKFVFSKFDPVGKCVLAKRIQFPLKLAYSVTIHKSQGMSLDSVTVDCRNASNPGQIGVAVGRVKTTEGLRVLNFKPSLCKPHPRNVEAFYENCNFGKKLQDNTCCKRELKNDETVDPMENDVEQGDESVESDQDSDNNENIDHDNDSDLSDVEIEVLEMIDLMEIPEDIRIALNNCTLEFSETPYMEAAAHFQSETSKNITKFSDWYKTVDEKLRNFTNSSFPENKSKFSAKEFHKFFADVQLYTSSSEYRDPTKALCQKYKTIENNECFHLLTSIVFYLQKKKIQEIDNRTTKETMPILKKIPPEVELTGPGRGKIRYVSGYVIAKLKYRNSKILRNSLFDKGKEEIVKSSKKTSELLDSLCVSYTDISQDTVDPDSLVETQRKQNLSEGLCNISDETFSFFILLEKSCRQLLTYNTLQEKQSDLYMYVQNSLLQSGDGIQAFLSLFRTFMLENHVDSDNEETFTFCLTKCASCNILRSIFHKIICLFVKVSVSQFRKNFLSALKVEKTKALRKKVVQKNQSKIKVLNMNFIESDTSENKQASHLRLKSELLQGSAILEKVFLKKHLITLCTAYNFNVQKSKNKSEIMTELREKILVSDMIPNPEVLKVNTSRVNVERTSENEQPGSSVHSENDLQPIPDAFISDYDQSNPRAPSDNTQEPSLSPPSDINQQSGPSAPLDIEQQPGPSAPLDIDQQPGPSAPWDHIDQQPGTSVLLAESIFSEELFFDRHEAATQDPVHIETCDPSISKEEHYEKSNKGKRLAKKKESVAKSSNRVKSLAYESEKSKELPVDESIPEGKMETGRRKRKTGVSSRKGKRKRKTTNCGDEDNENENERCTVCNKTYREGEQWICCDLCSLWFHRGCANLDNEDIWTCFTVDNQEYACPLCQ